MSAFPQRLSASTWTPVWPTSTAPWSRWAASSWSRTLWTPWRWAFSHCHWKAEFWLFSVFIKGFYSHTSHPLLWLLHTPALMITLLDHKYWENLSQTGAIWWRLTGLHHLFQLPWNTSGLLWSTNVPPEQPVRSNDFLFHFKQMSNHEIECCHI